MSLPSSMLRISAGACSLALLSACVVPVGATYSTVPAVQPAAPAAAQPAEPAVPATTARQVEPAAPSPTPCAANEIRVASGGCRPRSLGGGGGGDSGGGWS